MRATRAALALLLAAAALFADAESARYFVARARKARDAGDAEESQRHFEKALEEQKGFLPALLGLAEIAASRGENAEAASYAQECVAARGARTLSAEEAEAADAAEKLLRKLDPAAAEFRRLVEGYVAKLMALAERSRAENPALARQCLERVVAVAPENGKARELLATLGARPEPAAGGGIALWNGKDLDDWTGGSPTWTVKEGILAGAKEQGAVFMRHAKEPEGDFSVLFEMRIVKSMGPDPLVGMRIGARTNYDHYGIAIYRDDAWRLSRETQGAGVREIDVRTFKRIFKKFDPTEWNTYRLAVRGRKLTCFVNDKKVFEHEEEPGTFDGAVALWLQDRSIEVRRVVLLP